MPPAAPIAARPDTRQPSASSVRLPTAARFGGPLRLAQDLRIQLFAIVFALGSLHHEAQYLVQQLRVGPLGEYMERWSAAKPTSGWPSEVGLALHLAVVVVSVLVIVLPWRRALLCALAVPFLLSKLVSPDRLSSHSSVIVAALILVAVFALAEVVGRVARRARAEATTDWYGWTLVGLRWLLASTYAFAAFHKLNPVFFSPADSPAMAFVLPVFEWLPVSRDVLIARVGYPATFAAVLIEASLPFLLMARRTRLFGCLLGLVFHLPMMAQGLMDFPVIILAFYPLCLSVEEARAVVDRLRSRPGVARLACAAIVGGAGVAAIWTSRRVNRIYSDATDPAPAMTLAHSALLYLTMLLAAYVLAALAAIFLERVRRSRSQTQTPAATT